MVSLKTTASQVDHFDFTAAIALHQDILRLQIAVNEPQTMNELQGLQTLACYRLSQRTSDE
jgi:hypothetical protein